MSLLLCDTILRTKSFNEDVDLLVSELERLDNKTEIGKDDSEEEAINKLRNRMWSCQNAKSLYHKGIKHKNILVWDKISKNKDEFVEIRKIEFNDNSLEYN